MHHLLFKRVFDDVGQIDLVDNPAVTMSSIVIEQGFAQLTVSDCLKFTVDRGVNLEARLVNLFTILLE